MSDYFFDRYGFAVVREGVKCVFQEMAGSGQSTMGNS